MVVKFGSVKCNYCDNTISLVCICPACARKRPELIEND